MVLAPVTDQQGAIVDFRWNYVNRSAAAVFGREGASLTGAHISQLHPEMWQEPGLFEHLTAVALRQDVHDFEVRSIAGVQGWFQVIASSLDQEIGVWFHDVGERKRHEAELRAADQRKDEFLATLAHELRNPLAPIRMAAALAKKPDVAAAQQRWCHDVIDRQARHMSLLLDDLLDVSRITRGTLVVRRVPTLLASLVDSALETSRPLIESKQHALSVDFPRDAMVDVDPLRLAQIVSNLLNNAAKYTPAGGSIGLSIALDQGDLTIRVRDTGIGIERSELDGIFSMFSQVERAQDRAEGGLGIGLALARGLVELHGGTISARSDGIGRGSVFTVRIPRALVDAPVPSAVSGAARSTPSPLRILIADDNVDAAQSLAMLLSCDGHECLLAAEGDTALGVFHESSPDVILLDIGMPRMSGLEVARRIRAVDAGVLLIAVTGWGQTCDRQRSAEAGFDHHLTKPVDHEALALLLDSETGGADRTRTRSRGLF
jgi:signal transduction histidine kinase/CheY-like chemotaxis protein